MDSLRKQHRALLGGLVWWLIRRRVRARAESLVSGEALGLRSQQKGRTWWKGLLALTVVGGVGWFAWQRLRGGGGDDWGTWEPTAPEPPAAGATEPSHVDASEPAVPAGA